MINYQRGNLKTSTLLDMSVCLSKTKCMSFLYRGSVIFIEEVPVNRLTSVSVFFESIGLEVGI